MSNVKPFRYCHLCGKTESVCFSFPKQNLERRKEWSEFCNITDSGPISVPFLCEEHFEAKFILKKRKNTFLHGYAVPTIRVESLSSLQEEDEPLRKKYLKNCCICGPTDSHLHKFPKDEIRKNEWLDVVNMKGDKRKDLRLCDSHFPDGCTLTTPKGRVMLKRDAKPVIIDRRNIMDMGFTKFAANSIMPELDAAISAIDSAASMIDSSVPTNSTRPANNTFVYEIDSSSATFDKTGLNQITFGNVRQSVLQLLMAERVDVESTKISEHDSEVNISNVSAESNDAASKETMEVALECEITETSTSDVSENMSTPTTSASTYMKQQRRQIRFLGDITTPSLQSPTTRKKCLSVIRTYRLKMGKKMKLLKQENSRLKMKITNLKSLLSDLKKKNMITESAATTLLVNFNNISDNL